MENQFVPYELAVKLKDLRFDLDVNAGFCGFYRSPRNRVVYGVELGSTIGELTGHVIVGGAPLWQQVFDWFTAEYNLSSVVGSQESGVFYWQIDLVDSWKKIPTCWQSESDFRDIYEARKDCVEKLIDIVENRK